MKMRQISQHEAEELVAKAGVVSSRVERKPGEMKLVLTLSNHCIFVLNYNLQTHLKQYFMLD